MRIFFLFNGHHHYDVIEKNCWSYKSTDNYNANATEVVMKEREQNKCEKNSLVK
jgi:hypothetical protein